MNEIRLAIYHFLNYSYICFIATIYSYMLSSKRLSLLSLIVLLLRLTQALCPTVRLAPCYVATTSLCNAVASGELACAKDNVHIY